MAGYVGFSSIIGTYSGSERYLWTISVRREKALVLSGGRIPPGNWIAPPGSNRSSSGGDEAAEASDVEGRFRRLGEHAGRNVSER